jgi:hypothetical protein
MLDLIERIGDLLRASLDLHAKSDPKETSYLYNHASVNAKLDS